MKEAVCFNIATSEAVAFVVGSQRSDLNHRTMLASRSSLAVVFDVIQNGVPCLARHFNDRWNDQICRKRTQSVEMMQDRRFDQVRLFDAMRFNSLPSPSVRSLPTISQQVFSLAGTLSIQWKKLGHVSPFRSAFLRPFSSATFVDLCCRR